MAAHLPKSARIAGVQIPVVTVMIVLVLIAIIVFDGLARESQIEIQICAFTGIFLLVIDAIASGTTSVRDRHTLLTLSWGITGLAIIMVILAVLFDVKLPL